MPDHTFFFEMDLSSESRFQGMLLAVGDRVLHHCGYAAGAMAETLAALQAEVARGAGAGTGRCHVLFRVGAGQLEIEVVDAGGRAWRVTRPLP